MTAAPVTITLPLPTRPCHPNSRAGWRAKARAMAESRRDGFLATLGVWSAAVPFPHWERAHLTVQAIYPDRRRRDGDGLLASMKGQIDGIVDSGLIADDDQLTFTVLPPIVDKAAQACVMIVVTGG